MARKKYTSVSIPVDIAAEIDMIVKESGFFGYANRADFVKESIKLNILLNKKLIKLDKNIEKKLYKKS